MDKQKYMSEDSRTGTPEGEIVELTIDELNRVPFNVKLKLLKSDDKKDAEKIKNVKVETERVKLRTSLLSKGLSTQRTDLVVDKYGSLEELKKHADKANIDKLTDDLLKKEFSGSKNQNLPKHTGLVDKKKEGEQ